MDFNTILVNKSCCSEVSQEYTIKEHLYDKILSIDGGGIRGIIPAIVLSEIEKRTGKPINKLNLL